jgi:hypothetical protein
VSTRLFFVIGLAFGTLSLMASRFERRASAAFAHHAEDVTQLDALVAAWMELETGVLESRAGIQLNFDSIDNAVLSLRSVSRQSMFIRGRGAPYAEAADALDRIADEMSREESSLETLKTDLALLRLSSRYFPIAASALSHIDEAVSRQLNLLRADIGRHEAAPTPETAWRIASELTALDAARVEVEKRAGKVGALRADVERFVEAPSRVIAQRLEAEIPALEASRASFEEAARADLDVLLGHTRVILDRSERVDRAVRLIVRSPVRIDAEAASAAYERAARREFGLALALKIAALELGVVAVAFFAAAAWIASRSSSRHGP